MVTPHEVTVHRRAAQLQECELEVARLISGPGPADDVLTEVVRVIGTRMGWAATEFWTVDEVAGALRRNTGSLYGLVLKLLDVAGLRSGHIDVRRRPMDLAEVVRAATGAARGRLGGRVTIDLNSPAAAPVDGDPERLRQVVDELLGNALAWAGDGSVVGVSLHADPHAAVLSVANAGAGIRDDERAHLFDLFFRGEAARHGGLPGNGLGLTLVRAIVEQHGGMVSVSDPEEATTVFTVRIPTRLR